MIVRGSYSCWSAERSAAAAASPFDRGSSVCLTLGAPAVERRVVAWLVGAQEGAGS